MDRFETYFGAFYAYFTTETVQFEKILGQFENLGFAIMSTRENIRLIARAPSHLLMRRLAHPAVYTISTKWVIILSNEIIIDIIWLHV